MEVQGLTSLMAKLKAKDRAAATDTKAVVVVGYTQAYALYVHENLEAKHKEGKQAKFLEAPARQLSSSGELGRIVAEAKKAGKTLAQGLLLAGLRIQRESQRIVPIDTGALRASAFTKQE